MSSKTIRTAVAVIILTALPAVKTGAQETHADSAGTVPLSVHSARTAVIRSALLPGWGQWYNDKKIKAVLIVAGEAGLAAAAVVQNQRAVNSSTEYERSYYQDDRGRYIWYAAALWLLNVVDAFVDAKLYNFDVSDDLSMQAFQNNRDVFGIRVSLRF